MNEILTDLKTAINQIPEFYYSVPNNVVVQDELQLVEEKPKNYERRFVSQLKSEYDQLIRTGTTGNYNEVNTDFEVIKKYIYSENNDYSIERTFLKLGGPMDDEAFKTITTIPDFFIHKAQNDMSEKNQKLVVEVKTVRNVNRNSFFLDLFKLNVYVEKYNFQNGVFLLINNSTNRIEALIREYQQLGLYRSPNLQDRIYFFIKESYDSELEIRSFVDNESILSAFKY